MKKMRLILLAVGLGLALVLGLMLGLGGQSRAAEAAPEAQTGQFITVTVQSGESLVTYTRIYGVTGLSILAVNNIPDPNIIFPGQVITIPVVKSFTPSLTTPFYYTVQAGDNIFSMALKFETDASVIANANDITDNIVILGRTYLIPAGPHKHIAQAGEDLRSIAARYGVSVSFVIASNNLPNPDFIYVGQPIWINTIYNAAPRPITAVVIPATATATPLPGTPTPTKTPASTLPTPTKTPAVTPLPGNLIKVVVRSGESLLIYSFRYGVNGSSLVAVNPQLADPSLIFPGDIITIPVAVSFTPSRTTPFFYVVAGGDTTTSIAGKFEMTSSTLLRANPSASFLPGETILIPAGPHLYLIKAGDELKTIAAKYGTTVSFLLTGNNLPNPDVIYVGQTIFVPVRYNAAPMPFG
jgi:LysM repeat protein